MSYMKPTITVRLPEDLRSELEDISEAERKPLSDIVRDSIRRYVAIYQFRRLRGKVLPFAEAQGLLTDEDVFEALS
jgi:predicted transcriptional regulator